MDSSTTFRWRDILRSLARMDVLWRRIPTQRVFLKQVYFSGLQALPLVTLVGAAVAGIIVGQLRLFGESPKESVDILLKITLGELAPLLTAFLVTARSAPAMASELATMRVNGEVRLLDRLGVPPLDYLVIPRVTAMATSTLLLSIYFAFAAVLIGSVFAAQDHAWSVLLQVGETLRLKVVLLCVAKSLLFGIAVSATACYTGLRAGASFTEVPIAASRAVVRSLAGVFVLDFLLVLAQ